MARLLGLCLLLQSFVFSLGQLVSSFLSFFWKCIGGNIEGAADDLKGNVWETMSVTVEDAVLAKEWVSANVHVSTSFSACLRISIV